MRGHNFIKLGQDIGQSSMLTKFVSSEFRYIAAFSIAGGSKSSGVENKAKFRTFCSPVKIRDGWVRCRSNKSSCHVIPDVPETFKVKASYR